MIGNGLIYSTPRQFQDDLREEKPEVVYSFSTVKTPNKRIGCVIAVFYGGESRTGHWFDAKTGREIAIVTRYNDNAPEPNLYTPENWLAFFVEHTNDFYGNWETDDWGG